MYKILVSLLLIFLGANTIFANPTLQKGISLYGSGKYDEAIKVLNTLAVNQKDPVNSPKATIILTKI